MTEKIEDELREIAEIEEIKSVSRTGISVVNVKLSHFISDTELEQTWSEVRDAPERCGEELSTGCAGPRIRRRQNRRIHCNLGLDGT